MFDLKRVLSLLFLISIVFFPSIVYAQTVNTYELFWPIVAGRTKADSWYSLKIAKENLRGKLILNQALKSDYALFLAVKRILEAGKLLQENKEDLANQTLMVAIEKLKATRELKAGVDLPEGIQVRMRRRTQGLDQYLEAMSGRGKLKSRIDLTHEAVLQIF